MGWKSDWLYRLVFQQFEQAWMKAQAEGASRFGPAPESLLVGQHSETIVDGVSPYCRGPIARKWCYAGGDWTELESGRSTSVDHAVRGMFFQTAIGRFCISPDRMTVVIEYVLGPRYGRGFTLTVEGQGDSAVLMPETDSVMWHS